jgi:hypothetical protein
MPYNVFDKFFINKVAVREVVVEVTVLEPFPIKAAAVRHGQGDVSRSTIF